jgi:hypothetical protein
MKKSWFILVTVLLLVLVANSAFGLQMITNGNFEMDNLFKASALSGIDPLSGWNIGGNFPFQGAFAIPNYWSSTHPELGDWSASVAPPFLGFKQAVGTAILYQDFIIPAGMGAISVDFQYMPWSYSSENLDFVQVYMRWNDGGGSHEDMYQSWLDHQAAGTQPWSWQHQHLAWDVSGLSYPIECQLAFGVSATRNSNVPTGLFVDNVSVEATPEPATLLLLGGGLLGMGAIGSLRRRKK